LVFEDCDGITRIAIPKSVTKMGKNVFSNCDELIAVYCEAQSKPSGWNYYWEPEYPTLVHWGSTGN